MREINIDIVLEVSNEIIIPAIAKCIILTDRINEEYGDDIKVTNLPYYKIKDVVYDESKYLSTTIKDINNHILEYWNDIEHSIN